MSLTPISSWIKPLNEAFTVSQGSTQSFSAQDLVGDDEGLNGSVIRLESVGAASHGSVKLVNGQYTYTPAAGYIGEDSFNYTVTDQFGNHCTETVVVRVTAAPPVVPAAVLPPVITDVIDDAGASTGKVNSGGTTDDTLPMLKGTGEPGSTVTLYDNGARIGTVVVGADWQWTFTPTTALPSGVHAFTVVASRADGSGSTPGVYPYSISIGGDIPPVSANVLPPVITDVVDDAGSVTGKVSSGGSTDDTLPTLKGTGEPGSTITLYDNGVKIGTVVAGADWQWSFTPGTALPSGLHAFTATASHADGSGATPGVYAYSVTIGGTVTPPSGAVLPPVITDLVDDVGASTGKVADGGSTDDSLPTLKGTGEPGSVVSVFDNGVKIGTAVAGPDWQWTFTPTAALPAGTHAFTVSATRPDGTGGSTPGVYPYTVSLTGGGTTPPVVTPGAPIVTITTDANNDGSISQPEFANRATVQVTLPAGAKAGDTLTVSDADGHITGRVLGPVDIVVGKVTLLNAFPTPRDGETLTVSAKLIGGNGAISPAGTDSAVIDLSAPSAPVVTITTDDNNDRSISKAELDAHQAIDVKVDLPVDARAGDTLTVVDQAGRKVEKVLTAADITAKAVTLDNAFPAPADGQPVKVIATVSDPVGNVSPQGSDAALIHTTAPGVGVVIVDDRNNDGTISRTEIAGATRVDVRIDLPDGAGVGDRVEIKDQAGNGVSKILTGADVINHQITFLDAFPLPASGAAISVTAKITDTAGNVSPAATDSATFDGNYAPVSINDTNAVKGYVAGAAQQQGVTATGNVLANDTDADGPATALKVAGVSSSAATLQAGTGVESVLEGRYGHLTVHADGSYTYVSDKSAGLTGAVDDVFYYLNKDANGAVSGDPAKLTIHVEPPFAQVLSVSSPTVVEGGSLDFTVTTSSAGSATPITLALQSGTATVGTDTGNPVQVNFGQGWVTVVGNVVNAPAGTTSFQVRVPTTDDTAAERAEQFSLTASTPTGSQASGMGAITDNDLGGTARGTEDTPLTLTADNFHIGAGQKLVIDSLPADGKLQYNNGGTWTAVTAGQEVTRLDIDAGKLRFVPDANESGIDANAPGVGNMKSDYARAGYSLVDTTSGDRLSGGTLAIDIAPVADGAPKMTGNVMSSNGQGAPAGFNGDSNIYTTADGHQTTATDPKGYQGYWEHVTLTSTNSSPDTDGSEKLLYQVHINQYDSPRALTLVALKNGTFLQPDANGDYWVKAADAANVYEFRQWGKGPNGTYASHQTVSVTAWNAEYDAQGHVVDKIKGNTLTSSSNTPLVLDLNGDGVHTVDAQHGVHFDFSGTGAEKAMSSGWVDKQDGLLVLDRNANGQIDNGTELFGDAVKLADGSTARDGFQALATLDSNHDGQVSATDADFGKLQLWVDANSDGVTQNGELQGLAQYGVTSLSLEAAASSQMDNGNTLGLVGNYTTADGTSHAMVDVWFAGTDAPAAGLDSHGHSLDQLLANAGLQDDKPAAPAARPDRQSHDTHHSAPAAPADLHLPAQHDWSH